MSEEQEDSILQHLDEHENQSVRQISDTTGISSIDVRRLLYKLELEGEVVVTKEKRTISGWGRKAEMQIWNRSSQDDN